MAISILELHRPPGDDELFSRYLGELLRHGDPEPERTGLAPGNDVRTCTRCGEHALFRVPIQVMHCQFIVAKCVTPI